MLHVFHIFTVQGEFEFRNMALCNWEIQSDGFCALLFFVYSTRKIVFCLCHNFCLLIRSLHGMRMRRSVCCSYLFKRKTEQFLLERFCFRILEQGAVELERSHPKYFVGGCIEWQIFCLAVSLLTTLPWNLVHKKTHTFTKICWWKCNNEGKTHAVGCIVAHFADFCRIKTFNRGNGEVEVELHSLPLLSNAESAKHCGNESLGQMERSTW